MKQNLKLRSLIISAVLGAISYILMFLEISVPIVPAFVKFDFSDLPALIGAFSLGPVFGILIELIKNLLHLFQTSSFGVGELSNFILGASFSFTSAYIYRKNPTRKSALIATITGTFVFAILGFFSNYFIIFPFYTNVAGIPMQAIIEMGKKISPFFDSTLKIILLSITPFNILKGIIISVITFLIYKYLNPILNYDKNK